MATHVFLSAEEFNEVADISKTNCLAFAFGQTKPEENSIFSDYNLDRVDCDECYISIEQAFLWKARRFGIKVHEIEKITDIAGKTAFLVWGWYEIADFHIVRHNPDGSFVHKPDWKEPAARIQLEDIFDEYPEDFHIFVLDEE